MPDTVTLELEVLAGFGVILMLMVVLLWGTRSRKLPVCWELRIP